MPGLPTFAFALVLLVAAGSMAAETSSATGTGSTVTRTLQSSLTVEDLVEGHRLFQSVGLDRIGTTDVIAGVPFDGAEFRTYEQSDFTDGSGLVRGYGVWQAKTGERLYLIYGYSVPPFPAGTTSASFSGTFEWVGGTGPLTRVSGKGTLEGEMFRGGKIRYHWAGSYEQPTPSEAIVPPK